MTKKVKMLIAGLCAAVFVAFGVLAFTNLKSIKYTKAKDMIAYMNSDLGMLGYDYLSDTEKLTREIELQGYQDIVDGYKTRSTIFGVVSAIALCGGVVTLIIKTKE